MLFKKITILGVGLIGGSLARALKRDRLCEIITGYGRDEVGLQKAVELGVVDDYSLEIKEAVRDADVIMLATPLSSTERLLANMKDGLKPDCIITDVGSAKGVVVNAARKTLPERMRFFVPAHPIAGTERSGVESSFAELFEQHVVIITPLAETDEGCKRKIAGMWEGVGGRVVELSVAHHDQVLAATSHLPHVLAYALVDCLGKMQDSEEMFHYAAGGFADFTRIASSSPRMWHDVCLANSGPLLGMLAQFDRHLQDVREAIANGESERLLAIFSNARRARERFIDSKHKD